MKYEITITVKTDNDICTEEATNIQDDLIDQVNGLCEAMHELHGGLTICCTADN